MICFRVSFVALLAAVTLALLLVLCLTCEQSNAQDSLARYTRQADDDNNDDSGNNADLDDPDDQQAADRKTTPKPRRKATTRKSKRKESKEPYVQKICIFKNKKLTTVYGLEQLNFNPICHPGACHEKSRKKCPDDPFDWEKLMTDGKHRTSTHRPKPQNKTTPGMGSRPSKTPTPKPGSNPRHSTPRSMNRKSTPLPKTRKPTPRQGPNGSSRAPEPSKRASPKPRDSDNQDDENQDAEDQDD